MAETDLYGLILIGGRSSRMGHPKSEISYHGVPQREYLYSLLQPSCESVYFSVKSPIGIENEIADDLSLDSPINGIVSAFRKFPSKSWLVIGCDLPNIDRFLIDDLVQNRDSNCIFSGYYDSDGVNPEPMIGIWESGAGPLLELYIDRGYYSPRQFIGSQKCLLRTVPHDYYLLNVNTPDERDQYFSN